MTWHLPPHVVALALMACVAIIFAVTVWRRSPVPGRIPFGLAMMGVAEWEIFRAFEGAALRLEDKVFFARLEYLGIVSVPVLWLIFALEYSQQHRWLTRRRVAALFFVPVLTLLMVATNDWHQLHWTSVIPSSTVPGDHLIYGHGPYFFVHVLYCYAVLTAATLALWRTGRAHVALYRRQTWLFLLGLSFPWLANVIYVAGLSPDPGLDPTPFAFTLTGITFVWGVFRRQILDVVPVARDLLIERLVDGILVIDAQNRVVDINPAARRLIGTTADKAIGMPAWDVLSPWPKLVARFRNALEAQAEVYLDRETQRCLELRIVPLHDRHGEVSGRLIVFRDISARKQAEEQLRRANERLQAQLVEIEALQAKMREQAIRDPLTGLFNRRYLEETLERELARAQREKAPVSMVIMDIDHFKQINDTYGHQAGDLMLQSLAGLLQAQVRTGDVACRYGGEEFVVVLPGASIEVAHRRAEHLREAFRRMKVSWSGASLEATLSLGIAAWPAHGSTADEVLRMADRALYAAKRSGRDRTVVAELTHPRPGRDS